MVEAVGHAIGGLLRLIVSLLRLGDALLWIIDVIGSLLEIARIIFWDTPRLLFKGLRGLREHEPKDHDHDRTRPDQG